MWEKCCSNPNWLSFVFSILSENIVKTMCCDARCLAAFWNAVTLIGGFYWATNKSALRHVTGVLTVRFQLNWLCTLYTHSMNYIVIIVLILIISVISHVFYCKVFDCVREVLDYFLWKSYSDVILKCPWARRPGELISD